MALFFLCNKTPTAKGGKQNRGGKRKELYEEDKVSIPHGIKNKNRKVFHGIYGAEMGQKTRKQSQSVAQMRAKIHKSSINHP